MYIRELIEKVIEYAKKQTYPKGWYAASYDGTFIVKCDDSDTAYKVEKYVFFYDLNNCTVYKA